MILLQMSRMSPNVMTVAIFADRGFASAAYLQAGEGSVDLAEDVIKQEVIVDEEGSPTPAERGAYLKEALR